MTLPQDPTGFDMRIGTVTLFLGLSILPVSQVVAQQTMDSDYGDKITEYTTESRFSSDLVDHLPYSTSVPSPLDFFGTIIGDPSVLHRSSDIYAYFRALAGASDRVQVRSIGTTEEGREMIEVLVSSAQNMSAIEANRERLNRLADPRTVSDEEADALIRETVPMYYLTAGLHSPETGSPEMVMELAYRVAVEENPFIEKIRDHVILAFTPVAEPDGRDRVVDTYRYAADHGDVGPGLPYWGKYVAHDNNRDGFGLSLALTRNILGSFLYWKPQVMHDLHESVSYLYTSTGLGPYNEYIDPITVDEWHNLAYAEVSEMTRRDMPGVWTHAFYNGWAANYLIWIANTRNSNGRFYETFGNSVPGTYERKLSKRQTSREWYRSNPPLEKAMWSLRNNTNYMETGVLLALAYTADNAETVVENFYLKSKRSVEKGRSEAPYAWVIPHEQLRPVGARNLVNLLMQQGLEVHQATDELSWMSEDEEVTAGAGSWIIRLDQPYRTLAQILLDKQAFPEGAKPPYDDTGWTLPMTHNVTALRVEDASILDAKMDLLVSPVPITGHIDGKSGRYLVVRNTTDDNFTVLRFRFPGIGFQAAEGEFEVGDRAFSAGSFVVDLDSVTREETDELMSTIGTLGLLAQRTKKAPDVGTHEVEVASVALVHTWVATPQDAGWWRLAFDRIGIPYTYLSEQDLATTDLGSFDVIILPRAFASPQQLVAGKTRLGDAVPWEASEMYPALGHIDQTKDVRAGMGYEGVAALKRFVEQGGVFITEGSTAAFPVDMAITRRVSIKRTKSLQARGSIVRTTRADSLSPLLYGYKKELPAYFNQSPVFTVSKTVGNYRTSDDQKDAVWSAEVPRTILTFAKKDLNMSGMLAGEKELSGAPALLDVPVGEGHVLLFAIRPFRRWNTQGNHALVFNAILGFNDLRIGWPERPTDEDDKDGQAGLDSEF